MVLLVVANVVAPTLRQTKICNVRVKNKDAREIGIYVAITGSYT